MFPVETAKLIQETACKAEAAQILDVQDPANYHLRIGDQIIQIQKAPTPRTHEVRDMPSFIAAVEAFGTAGACSVWHSDSQVRTILDDSTRRDFVVLVLEHSAQLVALLEYNSRPLDQRSFCQMLKLRLGLDESFVGQFRRLDWSHSKQASGTSDRGRDRMGVSISDEVNGVADLADEVTLEIPVYDLPNLPYRYKIPCFIEIDATQQKLAVVTKPLAKSIAIDQAQADLHAMLENGLNANDSEHVTPVFYGMV